MSTKNGIRYLTDKEGNIESVLLPWDLWQKAEPQVMRLVHAAEDKPLVQQEGPLKSFEEFLQFWNFKYPYDPAVSCPHCGVSCADWRSAQKSFILTNANIGGLLVFHCCHCGSTIRQKHFRDHMAIEHTPPPARTAD